MTVRDSGIGLVAESLDPLFNTFYTTKPEGLGMRLAISRSTSVHTGGCCLVQRGPGRDRSIHAAHAQRTAVLTGGERRPMGDTGRSSLTELTDNHSRSFPSETTACHGVVRERPTRRRSRGDAATPASLAW